MNLIPKHSKDIELQPTAGLAKCGLDKTQYQLLFRYCAVVVGRDGTLLNKNFYLEL
jgi:hypothetical protein